MESKTHTKYLLEIKNLKKYFPLDTNFFGKTKTFLKAVEDVSFNVEAGKTIGIVGESGCGKTTMGRTILKLYDITGGNVYFHGFSLQEFAPAYMIKGIRKLPTYRNRYLALTAQIETLEAQLKELEAVKEEDLSETIKTAKEERKTLLSKAQAIVDESHEKFNTFIVSSDIKEVKKAKTFDKKIRQIDVKLEKLDLQEKTLQDINKKLIESTNEQEKHQLANQKLALENKIKIERTNLSLLKDHYSNFLLETLDNKDVKLTNETALSLIDLKLQHYEIEKQIKKCDSVINHGKEKTKINNLKAKLEKVFEESGHITGAYLLSDEVDEAKSALLNHSKYKKQYQNLSVKVKRYQEQEELGKDYKDKIEEAHAVMNDLEQKMTLYKDLIKKGKDRLKDLPLYNNLESRRANGININKLTVREMNRLRTQMQLIFQDPYSSLPPRMPIGEIIAEGVRVHKIVPKSKVREYVMSIMRQCGLQEHYYDRYPHEFSGGQRQRICIARALAVKPKLVVCDEPVSALDVSIQAQIINLLKKLQNELDLTYLFISHDLSVVKYISDDIGVMYLGSMVEMGDKKKIFDNPMHPYTQALFSAVPVPDPNHKMNRIILKGDIPSPANPPKGCKFHTRCIHCKEICKKEAPIFKEYEPGHFVACHLYSQKQQDEKEKE